MALSGNPNRVTINRSFMSIFNALTMLWPSRSRVLELLACEEL